MNDGEYIGRPGEGRSQSSSPYYDARSGPGGAGGTGSGGSHSPSLSGPGGGRNFSPARGGPHTPPPQHHQPQQQQYQQQPPPSLSGLVRGGSGGGARPQSQSFLQQGSQSLRSPPPQHRQQDNARPMSMSYNGRPTQTPPASMSGHGHSASRSSMGGQGGVGAGMGITTIAGEPLHDMGRALGLLKSSKFYAEGFLMKKVEVGPDGKAHPGSPDSQWSKWFVQLSGTIMSTWNAAEMEQAARENRTVPPQYLNLSDAFLHPYPPNPRGPPTPTAFQFALNSAGLNRYLFCAPTLQSLTMWINAIRLACWEKSRCNEIYTGTLLGLREPRNTPLGWESFHTSSPSLGPKGKLEGWLKARLPGDTEWRKVWTVVLKSTSAGGAGTEKKNKRNSLLSFGRRNTLDGSAIEDLPGDGSYATVAFYTDKPGKREQPLCIAQHLYYAAALFPESEKLIDVSALFKVEGTFLNPADGFKMGWGVGGRAEKQGFATLLVEEGDAMSMLGWLVGLADAFKLYGRPKAFSFDPRDPSSLYFALPVGPHRDRQFLDRELVDTLDINESRPRAIRAVFHNILFDRMRGVRPAALGPPPNQDVEALENQAQNEQPQQRNFGNGNGNRESPKLQHVLPAIGESSPVDMDGNGEGLEPYQVERERDVPDEDYLHQQGPSTPTVLPQQRQQQLFQDVEPEPVPEPEVRNHQPEDSVISHASSRSHNRSETNEAMSTYAAFMSSDISREPSPPPSQAQSFRSPPSIDTQAPPSKSFYRPPPHESQSPQMSEVSQKTGVTHLTYAGAQPSNGQDHYVPPLPRNPQSPVFTPPSPAQTMLTSPGASTTSPLATSAPMSAQRSEDGLAYMAPEPVAALPLPSYEKVREPVSPVNHSLAAQEKGMSPIVTDFGAPTESGTERELGGAQHGGDVPNNKRLSGVSGVSLHNGKVVDSPESIALASPHDPLYSTQPLFSPPASQQERVASEMTSREPAAPLSISTSSVSSKPPKSKSAAASASGHSFEMPEEYALHSDLLAGLDYLKRTESPAPATVPNTPSTTTSSPQVGTHGAFNYPVGPPSRTVFNNSSPREHPEELRSAAPIESRASIPPPVFEETPPSPVADNDEYGYDAQQEQATQTTPKAANASFPSTFAKNKRAEERAAAAQQALLAEQAAQASLNRPGRPTGASKGKGKQRAWQDSDDEESDPEEEEESVEGVPPAQLHRDEPTPEAAPPLPQPPVSPSPRTSPTSRALPIPPVAPHAYNAAARQSYIENGPQNSGGAGSAPSLSPASSIPDMRQEASGDRPLSKPILNPTGILHAGIIDKEERSARAQEHMARDTGGPLVSLPSKPPPPQTGLLGAITSHERDKERSGGVGRALTEQMRERKLAEQRQRQLDELQKSQLAQQQQQMQQMPQIPMGFSPYMMNPYMMNPYAMGGGYGMGMGMGSPPLGSPSLQGGSQLGGSQIGHGGMRGSMSEAGGDQPRSASPVDQQTAMMQQQQAMMAAQHAAQMAAQQAYMAAMSQFQPPQGSMSPSPSMTNLSMPGMSLPPMGMPFMSPSFYPQTSMPMPGSPSFAGQPFGGSHFSQGPGSSLGFNPYASQGFQQPQNRDENGDISDIPSGDSSPFAKSPVDAHANLK